MNGLLAILLLAAATSLPPWAPLKETVIQADLTTHRKEKSALVQKAGKLAEICAAEHPGEAGCYYYRAQATGLFYEIRIFGYQNGVRSMIKDWEKAKAIDPAFDHGGPDRMLGELFASLPKYFGTKDVRQDLGKAETHLKESVRIAPDYPTQRIDLAETLLKLKKGGEAAEALKSAQEILPQWTQDPYYPGWQETIADLEKQLLKGAQYGKRQ